MKKILVTSVILAVMAPSTFAGAYGGGGLIMFHPHPQSIQRQQQAYEKELLRELLTLKIKILQLHIRLLKRQHGK